MGFALRQLTGDEDGDGAVAPDGNRLEAFGVGPVFKFAAPHGVMYTCKFLQDFDVRNRPRGSQLWLYGAFRF